jgi:hypothetical protein
MNDTARANSLTNRAAGLLGDGDPQLLPLSALDEAGNLLEDAYKLLPDHPRSLYNLGNIRDEISLAQGGPFVSMDLYDRSLALRVTPSTLLNKARILDIQENDHLRALAFYERAVIQQGLYRGAYGMSVCMLMCAGRTGDPNMWRRGWYWFEHRKGKAEIKDHPGLWRGENLRDKRLLIIMETGLGDQIWALRLVKKAKDYGATTILICQPTMKRLCEEQPYIDEVHLENTGEAIQFDYITPVMSMPTYLDPTSRYKAFAPYIEVPFVPIHQTARIGLAWHGSVTRGYPAWRNVPFDLLAQYLPINIGIEYVSLQKSALPHGLAWPHMDYDSIDHCSDLYDTAQLVRSLDLVVTIGSVISMLAPALGVPTWLLNTHNSAWQFGPVGSQVDWFEQPITQFCQRKQADWAPVLAELTYELRAWKNR